MDLKSECSLLESVEDNDLITNVAASETFGNLDEPVNNGPCVVEDNRDKGLFSDIKGKETETSGSVNLPALEIKLEVSPSPSMTRKGFGLKKWKRIRRDVNKSGGSSIDSGQMATKDLSSPVVNKSKRLQVSAEIKQKSEGSVSSTNAVVRSLDGFVLLGDSGLAMEPSFAAGTDSENSEDHSSKSSTAASGPKIRHETAGVAGFQRDKSSLRSLSGKNLTHSVQRGLQSKNRVETSKKARGERIKIEKENSHSSVESDLRSSNFFLRPDTYSTSNGIQSERPTDYDGEKGDEVQGSVRQFSDGFQGTSGRDCGGYEGMSPDDVVADTTWDVKEEGSENHGSSTDRDSLAESILALQSVQEALEKEVLKFRDIIKDVSIDDLVQDLHPEFEHVSDELHETKSEQSQPGEGVRSSLCSVHSEIVETPNREAETELEDLFKQKIEAEVEYLAMSRTVQKLKVAAVNEISKFKELKALASERAHVLYELGYAGNKDEMLKKEAEKLKNFHEVVVSANETPTPTQQYRVCKYTLCFFLQLVLLVVILGVFKFQFPSNDVDIVPT